APRVCAVGRDEGPAQLRFHRGDEFVERPRLVHGRHHPQYLHLQESPGACDRVTADRLRSDDNHRGIFVTNGWNFADVYETIAEKIPDAQCQVQGTRRLTWGEVD